MHIHTFCDTLLFSVFSLPFGLVTSRLCMPVPFLYLRVRASFWHNLRLHLK